MIYQLQRLRPLALLAALIMASGWGWYHLSKHHIAVLIGTIIGLAFVLSIAFFVGSWLITYALKRYQRHPFWTERITAQFDRLFFWLSLIFIIYFFRSELVSIGYMVAWLASFFWYLHHIFREHPGAEMWQRVTARVGIFITGIFAVQAVCQLVAYHYYILDSNIKFFNIVLFRSIAMTGFWVAGFGIALVLAWVLPRGLRFIFGGLWSLLFLLSLVVWTANIGIVYYSGLYLSPAALDHAQGAAGVIENTLTFVLIAGALLVGGLFIVMLYFLIRSYQVTARRVWQVYAIGCALTGIVCCLGLSSFKNTPERTILNAFYQRYFGKEVVVELPSALQEKLQRFGLTYHTDQFAVGEHTAVYASDWCRKSSSTTAKAGIQPTTLACPPLLPTQFTQKKPNIIIIFLESYSARLTEVYNARFKGLTPGLVAMAYDPDTTIFKNYYNASTPTITGILSQLCSFLPPTGHNEIQNDRKLQNHHLLCLPEVLKKAGGYTYASYVTAVDKEFAHKEGIFTSMGVDDVLGTAELGRFIKGAPLSWGYSDHQMMPQLFSFMQARVQRQPFLMMLSTVDTHPPFNLAKDEVPYGDGKQQVLNAFHTTDDAFWKFWQEFRASDFASNTIVVAIADHAIFPAALTKDIFPESASQLTYYDENTFLLYMPHSQLPRTVTTTASGIDVTPTLLHLLGINVPNTFEGHSIFDDRMQYPNLIGMHELGLYINQQGLGEGKRLVDYSVPDALECPEEVTVSSTIPLTLCELKLFYRWKRQLLEQGRLWKE